MATLDEKMSRRTFYRFVSLGVDIAEENLKRLLTKGRKLVGVNTEQRGTLQGRKKRVPPLTFTDMKKF